MDHTTLALTAAQQHMEEIQVAVVRLIQIQLAAIHMHMEHLQVAVVQLIL